MMMIMKLNLAHRTDLPIPQQKHILQTVDAQ